MAAGATLEPTPRRRALARRAGVVPASAAWTAAGAWAGAAVALVVAGGAAAGVLAGWAAGALGEAPLAGAVHRARGVDADAVAALTLRLAAPVLVAAAAAALLAHGGLVRGLWLPRRRLRGAPTPQAGAARRAGDAVLALGRGAVVLAVAVRFAAVHLGDAVRLGAGAGDAAPDRTLALLGAAACHVAIAAVLAGAIDALERARRHRADLRMTPRERRDDEREARGDPRWRDARRRAAELPAAAAVRAAAVVVVGDRAAAAVRWHALAHPVPDVAARGRGHAAAQLVALARRAGVPAVHAPDLAAALAALAAGAPVPARHHAQLASILTAMA